MANKSDNIHIPDIYHVVKVTKTKISRTIIFLLMTGIVLIADEKMHITNRLNILILSKIFDIEYVHSLGLNYTSIYVSIAIVLVSDLSISRKIIFSTILLYLYVLIVALVSIYGFRYREFSLYVLFLTMSIPILLWRYLSSKNC